jgi:adenylate kinase
MRLILVGPPGSGKGTLASSLITKFNIPHISTGDMFRYNLKNNTPVGLEAKKFLDKGLLVPDYITNVMVQERLAMADAKAGFLLDGFPRNIFQADFLSSLLKDVNLNLDVVLFINAADEVIIRRLSGRRVCGSCGHITHVDNNHLVCPSCGGDLIIRNDDKEEVIKDRLKVYHEQTAPIIEYYLNLGLVREVDGNRDVLAVENEVFEVLSKI